MKSKKNILHYSLFAALLVTCGDAHAAIRVGNKSRSYAASYEQVNAIRNPAPVVMDDTSDDMGVVGQTENSNPMVELPIRVANQTLASEIARGDATSVTYGQLVNCGAIYPNGDFAWDTPTAGTKSASGSQCVSVVEMRGYQMGENGSDLVLARINLAAGDSIRCNISDWPEYSYLPSAGTVTFPNDAEPTVKDVIAVMDQEQKQHAGLKIAAGTLIAAVAGNVVGENAVGQDSLLGTNKEKLTSTAIGGLTGAAIMAGNAYFGKVAGDMILSAGVNAAAGGLIGNMAASGDSVMRIENCKYEDKDQKCLWGAVIKSGGYISSADGYYYNTLSENVYKCTAEKCEVFKKEVANIIPCGYETEQTNKDVNGELYNMQKIANSGYANIKTFYELTSNNELKPSGRWTESDNEKLINICSGTIVDSTTPAVMVGVTDRAFGWKKKDWGRFQKEHQNAKIMGRGAYGQPVALSADTAISPDNFYPMYVDAEDGGLIDLGNKARLKGTLIGAGAGGAMGAFTAYQGAQDDIQQRWVSAVREYKDSLQKVYCATGKRFLTHYNDLVLIPKVSE